MADTALREAAMAVREFTDSKGTQWRAWEVTPEALNPRTKDEDYLAQLYLTGWIVFETTTESEKRRLYPVPKGWSELPDPELEVLLSKGEIVPQRKLRDEKQATGEAAVQAVERAHEFTEQVVDAPERAGQMAREETPDVTDLGVLRSFRYPGGRIWVACVMTPDEGGSPVLRFSAGARHLELVDWPKDWADYPDEGLVDLLRRAGAREPGMSSANAPHRRHDDARA